MLFCNPSFAIRGLSDLRLSMFVLLAENILFSVVNVTLVRPGRRCLILITHQLVHLFGACLMFGVWLKPSTLFLFWLIIISGGGIAEKLWQCLYITSQNAHLFGLDQPPKLHHQDHSIREGSQHPKLDDNLGRASPYFHRDGKEKPHWHMELHKSWSC